MLRAIKIITISLLLLFGLVQICENIIYRNISISEPLGYYLALPKLPIRKGDLVLMCLTNKKYKHVFNELGLKDISGQCTTGMPYLIKQVVAIKGDRVEVSSIGILINGKHCLNSKQFLEGRGVKLYPLPIGYSHVLTDDEYFMLGQSPNSMDSRYFGIVKQDDIYRRAILIYELKTLKG